SRVPTTTWAGGEVCGQAGRGGGENRSTPPRTCLRLTAKSAYTTVTVGGLPVDQLYEIALWRAARRRLRASRSLGVGSVGCSGLESSAGASPRPVRQTG